MQEDHVTRPRLPRRSHGNQVRATGTMRPAMDVRARTLLASSLLALALTLLSLIAPATSSADEQVAAHERLALVLPGSHHVEGEPKFAEPSPRVPSSQGLGIELLASASRWSPLWFAGIGVLVWRRRHPKRPASKPRKSS